MEGSDRRSMGKIIENATSTCRKVAFLIFFLPSDSSSSLPLLLPDASLPPFGGEDHAGETDHQEQGCADPSR